MKFYRYTSSITGEFCTKGYALRNPETTQRETVEAKPQERPSSVPPNIVHMLEGMEKASPEDRAEWQVEIQETLGDWRRELNGGDVRFDCED